MRMSLAIRDGNNLAISPTAASAVKKEIENLRRDSKCLGWLLRRTLAVDENGKAIVGAFRQVSGDRRNIVVKTFQVRSRKDIERAMRWEERP